MIIHPVHFFLSLMQRLIILFASFLPLSGSFAQNLEMYTMEGCGNCAYAKKTLNGEKIPFIEHPVSDKQNEEDMLRRLREKGEESSIIMPVIFYNNLLVHPFLQSDTGYASINIDDALEYLVQAERQHTLAQDGHQIEHYLVCGEFPTLSRANHFILVLEMEGYSSAGYYEEGGKYYVYAMCTTDLEAAKKGFEELRTKYRGTHVVSF